MFNIIPLYAGKHKFGPVFERHQQGHQIATMLILGGSALAPQQVFVIFEQMHLNSHPLWKHWMCVSKHILSSTWATRRSVLAFGSSLNWLCLNSKAVWRAALFESSGLTVHLMMHLINVDHSISIVVKEVLAQIVCNKVSKS